MNFPRFILQLFREIEIQLTQMAFAVFRFTRKYRKYLHQFFGHFQFVAVGNSPEISQNFV